LANDDDKLSYAITLKLLITKFYILKVFDYIILEIFLLNLI